MINFFVFYVKPQQLNKSLYIYIHIESIFNILATPKLTMFILSSTEWWWFIFFGSRVVLNFVVIAVAVVVYTKFQVLVWLCMLLCVHVHIPIVCIQWCFLYIPCADAACWQGPVCSIVIVCSLASLDCPSNEK